MTPEEIHAILKMHDWQLMTHEVTDGVVTAQIYDNATGNYQYHGPIAAVWRRDQEEAVQAALKMALGEEVVAYPFELMKEPSKGRFRL